MKKTFCLSICLITFNATADLPLFTISGLPPAAFNTEYYYTVTNNAPYTLSNISLYYAPVGKTPQSFVQITSGANACGNYFSLAGGASCNLYYSIDPNLLVDNLAVGGPEICYNSPHPIYCSVPDLNSQVDLSYTIPSIIVGVSGNPASFAPYLVYNYEPGGAWATGNAPVPPIPATGQYYAVDCNDSLCVAAGYSGTINYFPLLISSIDNAVTWQNTVLSSVTNTTFLSAACAPGIQGMCIAGGSQVVGPTYYPSVYRYDYGTATWLAQSFPSTGTVNAAACADDYCVVGGNSSNFSDSQIFYSDGGSWNLYSGVTPPDATIPSINAISCVGSFCLAMGSQQITVASVTNNYPFMITSNDGIHWSTTDLRSLGPFELASGYSSPIGSLSCTSGLCVAGGVIPSTGSGTNQSQLLQTKNSGATWTQVTSLGTLASGSFNAVSCSPLICVAVGSSNAGGQIMGQTVDGGNTWTHLPISLPSTILMQTASCQDSFCFITGFEMGTLTGIAYQTTDAGKSWKPITFSPALASQVIFQDSYAH